jgi:hypothetical protein
MVNALKFSYGFNSKIGHAIRFFLNGYRKMEEKNAICVKETFLSDFDIIRSCFKREDLSREILHFNLTFLCWTYFYKVLQDDFVSLSNGGSFNCDPSDLKSFLCLDKELIVQGQRTVGTYNILFFKRLQVQWIKQLFESSHFVCHQIANKGLGLISKTNKFKNISSTLSGYLVELPSTLFEYINSCGHSSTMTGRSGKGLILYGLLSIINHECQCPFTFKYCVDGKLGITKKERLTSEGVLMDEVDEDEDEEFCADADFKCDSEIVVCYIFDDVINMHFECCCSVCVNK